MDAAPERTEGALYLGLNDCGEPDEVTGVPVGTIALHKPAAISEKMENKAFKGPSSIFAPSLLPQWPAYLSSAMANNLRGQRQRFVKFSDNCLPSVGAIILEKLIEQCRRCRHYSAPVEVGRRFWPPVRKKRDISRVGRSFADL